MAKTAMAKQQSLDEIEQTQAELETARNKYVDHVAKAIQADRDAQHAKVLCKAIESEVAFLKSRHRRLFNEDV